ncbi:MAG: hypothetical protein EU532_01910 [Promethearchaeota archaeon]|nr:MAG: hypothetical protein EU532_01910 [Candidatus Lokiarchaeota archaeon]
MRLINNSFNDIKSIKGFTKDELIEIKSTLTKSKLDPEELEEYLHTKFSKEILDSYSDYFNQIKIFINSNLISISESKSKVNFNYFHLKSEILNEIKNISTNLLNLKLNGRNVKRFLKNSAFLEDFLTNVQDLLDEYEELILQLKSVINNPEGIYDNYIYIWTETGKIKNLIYKVNQPPNNIENWEEVKEFYNYIEKISVDSSQKKKRKKKDYSITHHFNEIYNFYTSKYSEKIDFYSNLAALFYNCNILEDFEGELEDLDDYVNIIDRKQIKNKIKTILKPIIKELVENKLIVILNEIIDLDKKFQLGEDNKAVNLKNLLAQDFNSFMPQIIDYYLTGLEKKYHAAITELKEYDEFKNVAKFYSEKIEILYSLVEEIEKYITDYKLLLKPYDSIVDKFKKIMSNLYSEIERRKNEYLFYLKTIRKERLRDNIRNFVYEKTSEVNNLMSHYQDEASLIVREEFPQLKKIRNVFNDYKKNIQKIKEEVYKKLDLYSEKDIDIYQIIKQWEDNFTLKKQQLNFLLSLFVNKLLKNFKDLIEEEEILFDGIKEITEKSGQIEDVPLNFAISKILVDKLSEDELDERISEIHLKIENLTKEIELYRSELSNLKKTLSEKVKRREGITDENVQCNICRKKFDFAKDKIIKCPFCGAVYHYLCVAFWLSKYNSCPSCQNTFLDPNAGMYSDQD